MKKQSTMSFRDEIIDLTDSFTLANHCALADFIIELDEESYSKFIFQLNFNLNSNSI